MGLLDGKVALVTGAGTGIGRGIAELFAAEGAKVLVAARREEPLKEVAALAPGKISYVQMDLTNKEHRARALATAKDRYGKLDILVNNAAYQLWKEFMDTTDEEIDDLYYMNMSSTVKFIKMAVPYLRETKGNIVNISATAGRAITMPSEKLTVYGASKAGLNQLTRTLVPELGPMGIRINAIAPGVTAAEFAMKEIESVPGLKQELESKTPLGRIGEPLDIARSALFLASDLASWVTGQILDSSGGREVACG